MDHEVKILHRAAFVHLEKFPGGVLVEMEEAKVVDIIPRGIDGLEDGAHLSALDGMWLDDAAGAVAFVWIWFAFVAVSVRRI